MRDHHEILIKEAMACGATQVALLTRRKRHPQLVGLGPDGHRFRLIVTKTPSDWRSVLNERARLRRILRLGR
ncbi:hypothetical protein SAMN04487859_12333 [Roseovarius lutimaris]|uniref:Uncharacterized protein n=1 Tax=Roseovarius lutimaris TaxID=1005928 RepID=A0A1I5FZK5_9RHOB|nr:hypothetical protein [Roseovarius lutimaris]SFO29049.1 hypothetical protein SAMN04487859_12333 [Roseovarius lutimaris]